MTAPLCQKPCRPCLCALNRETWLQAEVERLQEVVRDKQRIIERLMDSVPRRERA